MLYNNVKKEKWTVLISYSIFDLGKKHFKNEKKIRISL